MLGQMKISVVIPTLNEAKGIRKTLDLIPKCVDEVVVVDGDSTDSTREIAAAWGAKVILEKRRGYGRAFRTGFEHCTGDLIATADGDGTYPIELLERIVGHLEKNQLDFVSCSRFPLQDASSMEKRNYWGNKLLTGAACVLWMHGFSDILSGMWVFRRSCLKQLTLRSDSWNFSEEIKIQAFTRLGKRFGEYAVPYRERLGETKLVPWKVGAQNLVYFLAMRTGTVPLIQNLIKGSRRNAQNPGPEASASETFSSSFAARSDQPTNR